MFLSVAFSVAPSRAQVSANRGTISGTVTADQGQVRAFRVKAHNLQYRIWYTVYTNGGHYQIPQALAGPYEMTVVQEEYASQGKKLDLASGQAATADLAVTRQGPPPGMVMADFDTIYPPGPGRELLSKYCMGCHGIGFYHMPGRDEGGWRAGLHMMLNGPSMHSVPPLGRTQMPATERDTIVKYLAANLNPETPRRLLKSDMPQVDEEAVSKAIFVEYDVAEIPTKSNTPVEGVLVNPFPWDQEIHDPFIAPDGNIWFSLPTSNVLGKLDPHGLDPESRFKTFPVDASLNVLMHGLTVDSKGHVYWAELIGGRLGEFDPASGKITRHVLPAEGSVFQVATDKNDNIWYNQIHGSCAGRMDAKTRQVSQWCTPTPDSSPYGMAIDQKGNAWLAAVAKGLVIKVDPVADVVTEYTPPTQHAGVRRLGVDSKGIVWFSEYSASQLGSLNPATGKITEYKFPLRFTQPYETWPDKSDNIWCTDATYASLVKFNQADKKFTYYPLPQQRWDVPKIEVEANNTIWFGSRWVQNLVVVHFYPNGYSASAPPEP